MSEREMCAQLLSCVPDFKLRYVLAYLQGLTADEMDDAAFCEPAGHLVRRASRGRFIPHP